METGLDRLNNATIHTFKAVMRSCCTSDVYASLMLNERPFINESAMYSASDRICASLEKSEWVKAISSHAEIGQKKKEQDKWGKQEQAEASKSSDSTLNSIRALSRQYFDRHRFIFLICATGKTGEDILAELQTRVNNPTDVEFATAIAEHLEITKIRLAKATKEYAES